MLVAPIVPASAEESSLSLTQWSIDWSKHERMPFSTLELELRQSTYLEWSER